MFAMTLDFVLYDTHSPIRGILLYSSLHKSIHAAVFKTSTLNLSNLALYLFTWTVSCKMSETKICHTLI